MRSPKCKTLAALAFVLATSPAAAGPKPLIQYFQPMPIVGKLSMTVWGASTVGPRDPANGLEDNGGDGGLGPQQETNFYWDGKILKGNDGKYHLYCSHWPHAGPNGFAGWEQGVPMEAISDDVMGPYVYQGDCYTKNTNGNDMGHNTSALLAPSGPSPYTLIVDEIVPSQMFSSGSPNGPWASLGNTQFNANGHNGCSNGSFGSNQSFTVGPDMRFWGVNRAGCIMDSNQVLGPYDMETDGIFPDLEKGDNGDAEDPVIWYSGGYYHIVYDYWDVQRAYHIMSKDGKTNWTSTGLAEEAGWTSPVGVAQPPPNSNTTWLRYTDGTVNTWHNLERAGVYQENGHVTHFTFAVTDVNKNDTSLINAGGSKILVVPFNGVQFDCDNGDQASCDELIADAGSGEGGGDAGDAATRLPGDGGSDGSTGGGSSSGATASGSSTSSSSGSAGTSASSSGSTGSLADSGDADAGTPSLPRAQSGCGCRVAPGPTERLSATGLVVFSALVARRRRRVR